MLPSYLPDQQTMMLELALLLASIILLVTSSVSAYQPSAVDGEQRFLQQTGCGPNHFYETIITLESEDNLYCTDAEKTMIGVELDRTFDDVVSIDEALANIVLDTTVCATASKRERKLQAGNEDPERHLAAAAQRKARYSWSGGGKCNLCTPDNADVRALLMIAGEHEVDQHRELREAYSVIDFNTDGKDNTITSNWLQYVVEQEWYTKYGMTIQVESRGGFNLFSFLSLPKAQIFNSANPPWFTNHLGSPNQLCPGGGAGIGAAGAPGMIGENCVPQGNILIVKDSQTKVTPNGDIVFIFASPTRVGHIGIMGSTGAGWLEVQTYDGKNVKIAFTGLGDNGVQIVHVDYDVKRIKVVTSTNGAVTEIGIFTPTTATEALSPTARSYLKNKNPFAELIPYLEFDLSYYLTRHINEVFGRDNKSCLFNKWVNINVKLDSVKNQPSTTC